MKDFFNAEAFNAAIAKSVVDNLTPEMQAQIIARAVENLIAYDPAKTSVGHYASEEDKARAATNSQINGMIMFFVRQCMEATMEKPENKARVEAACQQVVDQALSERFFEKAKDSLVEAVAKRFRDW